MLSNQRETKPELNKLLDCLRQFRCLIILDNLETLLDAKQVGQFRNGFEAYGELLHLVGEVAHQSCILLTSREKPAELANLEGIDFAVRSIRLNGSLEAGQAIIQAKDLIGTDTQKQVLGERYGNNPLALKIVATAIQELFAGEIDPFLNENTVIFNGLRRLLDQQFERLSTLEQGVMYWLAINREWTAIAELQADIVPPVSKQRLMETLESLSQRNLIEHHQARFTQQSVVMEYVTERLIERVGEEIASEQDLTFFNAYALIKATAKDYVRESQLRLILQPIAQRLDEQFAAVLEKQLLKVLVQIQRSPLQSSTYGAGNLLNLMLQLQFNLAGYDFSHLTIRQAWLQNTLLLQNVNFSHAHFIACRFAQALGYSSSLALSPDHRCVAIGTEGGSIYVFEVPTGKPLLVLSAHTTYVFGLCFSPDGNTIVNGGSDGSIKFWDVATGSCWKTLQAEGGVWSLACSRDGQWLASGTGGIDRRIDLWNLQTGQCSNSLVGHLGQASAISFDRSGLRLISGSHDATVKIWDLNSGTCQHTLSEHKGMIFSIKVHPQGNRFATASHDYLIKLWDLETGTCLHTFVGHTAEVVTVSFSSDGQWLASSSYDRTIRLWNVETGQCVQVLQGHLDTVWAAEFIGATHHQSSAETLVSCSWDQTVRFWQVDFAADTIQNQCIKTIQGSSIDIRSVAFHPQGDYLASAGIDCEIRLWKRSGQNMRTFHGHTSSIIRVAFHPQGRLLATASFTSEIRIWDIETGRCLHDLRRYDNVWVHVLAFSPQGYLVSSSTDTSIRFWNIQTGECFRTITLPLVGYALGLAFHPTGRYFVTAGNDNQLRWWETETGDCLRVMSSGHEGHVWGIAFHPQGHLIASAGSTDDPARLWDAETGKCVRLLPEHAGTDGSLAFSNDGSLLAYGGGNHIIHIFDVATGQCLRTLKGHCLGITSVTFCPVHSSGSAQPQILASGSYDETIRLWDVQTGECLQILRPERFYEGMNIQGVTGLSDGQKAMLKQLGAGTIA